MPLQPTRIGNVSLEYTSADDVDFDNDYLGIGSAANSGRTVKVKAKWLRDAIDPPLVQYDYIANVGLTADQSDSLITNLGAVAAITLTLPPAVAGMEYAIFRIAPYQITVTAVGADNIREGADGGSFVINTREMVVFSCLVDGVWEIVLGGAYLGRYSVRDFGAVGNGVVDDTAAVQAAYDACPSGGRVVWPTGTYKITSQLALRKNFVTTDFQGGGEDSGVNAGASTGYGCCILHVPTAAGTLFDIASATPSTTQLNNPGFVGSVLVYSTDTTYSKTAFKFTNVSRPYLAGRIHVAGATGQGSFYRGSTGGDGGSVGIYVLGREQYNFDNLLLYAQVPIRFGKNPSSVGGQYDMDHIYVSNAIFAADVINAPSTLIHSCILIDNDVRISIATFDGHIALVGGKHKVYWKPTDNLVASGRLILKNILTEQETDATAYAIHIEIPDASTEDLEALTLENCLIGADQYGIYTKNVSHLWLNGISAAHTTGQKLLKCEGASAKGTLSVGWENMCLVDTAPASIIELPADMQLSFATQTSYGDNRHHPHTARWVKANATDGVSQNPHTRMGPTDRWSRYGTIADGATWVLPLSKRYQGAELAVAEVTAKGNSGTCTFAIATPGVVTMTAHGFQAGKTVKFFTTSALPAALTADTVYYVLAIGADTFNVEATLGGGAIAFADVGTGTHTCAGTVSAAGEFTVSQGGGVVKLSGPANLVAGAPAADQLGFAVVTGQTGMDYCTLVSEANETLRVLITTKMYRSQAN